MEFAARPYLTASAILAAGLIAGPVLPSPSDASVRGIAVQLVAGGADGSSDDVLTGLLDQQRSFNSALIDKFFDHNGTLVATQSAQIADIATELAGADGNVHRAQTAVQQFFDANNALMGAGQAGLLGVLGARGTVDDSGTFTALDPAALNQSVIVDPNHAALIPYAGLQSAIGHYFGAAFFYAMINSKLPGDEIENGATGQSFQTLVNSLGEFNTALAQAEYSFNTELSGNEIALEKAIFGTDNAYGGAINHAFNSVNMMYDAQQQGLNGLLGITGYNPQEFTGALLIGSGDDGSIGGLTGMFSQQLMALDAAATAGGSGTPTDFTADPGDVNAALGALVNTVLGGPFGDTFAGGGPFWLLMSDLQALFADPLSV
ncbi:MAG TPA: hypothetical protein VFR27_00115 [Mycobacterium sp.]|nr:hypothetical protein [Mycobacterium sp.]